MSYLRREAAGTVRSKGAWRDPADGAQPRRKGGAGRANMVAITFGDIASGGTPAQNADLAKKVSREVENMMRGYVGKELCT